MADTNTNNDNRERLRDRVDPRDIAVRPRNGSGWNIAAGIWLIIAPFILGYGVMTAIRNDILIGAIVLIFGLVGISSEEVRWTRIINLLAGIWLFFSPFILNYSYLTSALWNDLVLGILVIAFSAWSLSAIGRFHTHHAYQHQH